MTNREAIEILRARKFWISIHFIDVEKAEQEQYALDMGIQALEKQEPKKPYYNSFYEHRMICSNCQEGILEDWMKYCPDCGQAIDWRGNR